MSQKKIVHLGEPNWLSVCFTKSLLKINERSPNYKWNTGMLLYKPFLIGSLCKTLNLFNLILMGALCGMILLQPRNNCIVELFIMILHADLYRRPPFFLQIFLFKWPFPWHILHTVNLLCCPQLWNNWHNLNVYWIISCSTLWWQISVSPGNDVTCRLNMQWCECML